MPKVLIPCSLSVNSRPMLAVAVDFARRLGYSMHFCHVAQDSPEIHSQLNLILADNGVADAPVTVKDGIPDKVIRRLAKDIKADLIIAGALEHESSLIGILGSVARRIVRKAPCSVLLLNANDISSQKSFIIQNALGCVVYNEASKAMVRFMIQVALAYQAKVQLAHLYDFPLRYLDHEEVGDRRKISKHECQCNAVEQQRLNDFIEGFNWGGVPVKGCCLQGKDSGELSKYAQIKGPDLLFISAPKRILFWQRFFSPQVEVLLQDLPCSTIFYRGRP